MSTMKEWWIKKKAALRKSKKDGDKYTVVDFLLDVLIWVPELLFLPFRMLFWMFRGLFRFVFDFVN